jgi:hypothetical protein
LRAALISVAAIMPHAVRSGKPQSGRAIMQTLWIRYIFRKTEWPRRDLVCSPFMPEVPFPGHD